MKLFVNILALFLTQSGHFIKVILNLNLISIAHLSSPLWVIYIAVEIFF